MAKQFWRDESGAVVIDWVALSAGILVVGITLIYAIYTNGVGSLTKSLNSALKSIDSSVSTGTAPDQSQFGN